MSFFSPETKHYISSIDINVSANLFSILARKKKRRKMAQNNRLQKNGLKSMKNPSHKTFLYIPVLALIAILFLIMTGCASKKQAILSFPTKHLNGKYSNLVTPKPGAIPVNIGLYMINIYDINVSSNTYYATGYVWLRWRGELDPVASLEFINAVDESSLTRTNQTEVPDILPNGEKYQVIRFQGRFF